MRVQAATDGRRRSAVTVLVLLVAAFVTASTVALLRYAWIDGWSGSAIDGNDHWASLLGTTGTFFIGGLLAVLICWFLEHPPDADRPAWKGGSVRNALIANAVCAAAGAYPLHLLTWNWAHALLLLLALCGAGSVTFVLALRLRDLALGPA